MSIATQKDGHLQVVVTPLLVDAETLGRMLGVSRKTIYNWLQDGRLGPLPVKTLGRRTLWKTSEVSAWVSAGCPERTTWLELQKSEKSLR